MDMSVRKPKKGKSLGDLYPELVSLWSSRNTLSPFSVSSGSHYKAVWICPIHGEYVMRCDHKTNGSGCKKCSQNDNTFNRVITTYELSMGFKYPNLVQEWSENNIYSCFKIHPSSHYLAEWVCSQGHKWKTPIHSRTGAKSTGCPYCTGKQVLKGFNDLLTTHPELCREWDYENNTTMPDEVSQGSHKRIWWKCKKGHSWDTTIKERAGDHRTGCPECAVTKRSKELSTPQILNSLGSLFPQLSQEYSGVNKDNPFNIYPNSNKKVWWECSECNYKWETYCYSRAGTNKTGCPHCFNLGLSKIENNLRQSLLPYGSLEDKCKIGHWEVDIYFPDSKTVIEYDGSRWHSFSGAWDRDRRKSLELLEKGYTVIRIRTWSNNYKLESLNIDNENYTEIFCKEPKDSVPSEELVEEIKTILEFDKGGYLL